ncbi:hypothetical protein ADU00_11540 [Salmonella enterica subsp. enterica]|nr:hypothetical protein [Salmonella enterica subsp. enterica serovar Hvittingfoss]
MNLVFSLYLYNPFISTVVSRIGLESPDQDGCRLNVSSVGGVLNTDDKFWLLVLYPGKYLLG